MDNKNLQITNHDFFIYRDSNNDIKVSVMLINNDIWLSIWNFADSGRVVSYPDLCGGKTEFHDF